jgi:hypothetical protein
VRSSASPSVCSWLTPFLEGVLQLPLEEPWPSKYYWKCWRRRRETEANVVKPLVQLASGTSRTGAGGGAAWQWPWKSLGIICLSLT